MTVFNWRNKVLLICLLTVKYAAVSVGVMLIVILLVATPIFLITTFWDSLAWATNNLDSWKTTKFKGFLYTLPILGVAWLVYTKNNETHFVDGFYDTIDAALANSKGLTSFSQLSSEEQNIFNEYASDLRSHGYTVMDTGTAWIAYRDSERHSFVSIQSLGHFTRDLNRHPSRSLRRLNLK